MKRYEAYKDSGVDWIGDIPEGWEVVRFKRLFKEKRKTTDTSLNSGSISFGEVVYKDDEKITEATKLSYQVLNEGEFLLNPLNMNYDLKSLRIGLSTINVVVSSGYIILQSKKGLNKNYYRWLLRMYDIVFMKTLGAGVRQTINYNDLADSRLIVPSFDEQQTIAQFLDNKTAKIDQLIGIKQKEIELLKERRQILIQQAVTKGLDATVPMKDSGVDWIGEIPEHWEVRKLKYVFDIIKTGTTPQTARQEYFDGEINWFNPKDLNNEILLEAEKSVTELAIKDKEVKLFPGDSILIVGIGATSGKTAYSLKEGTFNQQITGFHSKKDNNKFYYYFFKCVTELMLNLATYTTLPILNNEFFKSFLTIKPPLDEQKQIVIYLEDIEAKVSKAITLKEQEIEKLKEYKTVLIDNVVTGKVKKIGRAHV